MVTENKRFTRLFSEEQPTIRPRDNRAAEKVKTLVTREKHVPNKILSLSISWLLVRRLGRAKKRRGTEAEMKDQFKYFRNSKPIVKSPSSDSYLPLSMCW